MTSGRASASSKVFACTATWKDRQFQRAFGKLPQPEQDAFLRDLATLIAALEHTPHPASDPRLKQAFKAKPYGGVVALKGATLIEYSLGRFARVIAKYPASQGSTDILLLAVTLDHDHDQLKALIKQYRAEIDAWSET